MGYTLASGSSEIVRVYGEVEDVSPHIAFSSRRAGLQSGRFLGAGRIVDDSQARKPSAGHSNRLPAENPAQKKHLTIREKLI